jgi:hypothetical protein
MMRKIVMAVAALVGLAIVSPSEAQAFHLRGFCASCCPTACCTPCCPTTCHTYGATSSQWCIQLPTHEEQSFNLNSTTSS